MALTYDLETDIRFQQGAERAKIEAVKEMLQDKISLEKIAKYLNVSIEFVKKVADSLNK